MNSGNLRLALPLAGVLLIGACAAPGTPPSAARNERQLSGCQQVAGNAPARPFMTDYYLTTSASAISEGALAGIDEELESAHGVASLASSARPASFKVGRDRLIKDGRRKEGFCMVIDRPIAGVDRATRSALAELGPRGYSARKSGNSYQTNWSRHDHRAAKWIDRYTVSLRRINKDTTSLTVLRDIYISRERSADASHGLDYFQATSVGSNETAILTRVRNLSR